MSDYLVSFKFHESNHISQYYHLVNMCMTKCLFPENHSRELSKSRLISETSILHFLMTQIYSNDTRGFFWFNEDEFAIIMLTFSDKIQYFHKKDELQSLADNIENLIKQIPKN